jgi:hypothetical protein
LRNSLSPVYPSFVKVLWATCKQVFLAEVTIAAVLALAYVMNYSGATATLGLVFATIGVLFPFFSAVLGGLGGFLTGSNTSASPWPPPAPACPPPTRENYSASRSATACCSPCWSP